MPESKALASVSSTASTRLAAILRQASDTVVPSGIVSALDNLSFLTVLSPTDLVIHINNIDDVKNQKNPSSFHLFMVICKEI